MELALRIGADVACTDEPAGSVIRLIVDPTTQKVTHLVVDTKPHFGYAVLVPENLVTSADRGRVQLSCCHADLGHMERFEQTRYVPVDPEEGTPSPEAREYLIPAAPMSNFEGPTTGGIPYVAILPSQPVAIVEGAIPDGEVTVGRNATVRTADGHTGHVEEVVVDPATGRMTRFVMRTGHLWGRRPFDVPATAITEVQDDLVRLRLTRDEVEALPEQAT